jgi:thiol-disulfide isomerase/thioredoxin
MSSRLSFHAQHCYAGTRSGVWSTGVQGNVLARCPGQKSRSPLGARALCSVLAVILIAVTAHAKSDTNQEWKTAFASAKVQKRLVFVEFYATWCGPCKVMDTTVFNRDDVKEKLANFVQVRIDVDQGKIARSQGIIAMPSYVVYDPGQRELIRFTGAQEPNLFRDAIDQLNGVKAAFIRASDLYDEGKDLDGAFETANAFTRLRLTDYARTTLRKARKAAEREGKTRVACIASIQEAFTFAIDGNTNKSIKLLQQIIANSATDNQTAPIAWLNLGDVEVLAKNSSAARDAYQHVQSVAAPDTPAYKQAGDALAKLH